MSVTPQQLSRMTIAHNLAAIDAHLAREHRAEIGDETLQIAADLIWRRDIAMSGSDFAIRPEKLREGITEVMGTADDDEIARLADALARGAVDFGEILEEMVREYWTADCTERAREQLERLDRVSEDEAAASRMGY